MILKCKICAGEFKAKPFTVKMGWGKFCSRACHHKAMQIGQNFSCFKCEKLVYRSEARIQHSKSGKYFCSKTCQTKWRNEYFSGDKHRNWVWGESTYRKLMINKSELLVCKRCSRNDMRVLAVHHIDRNRQNNDISNLMWLCRNCHFLIHHDKVEDDKLMEALV